MSDLKPCPFCGGAEIEVQRQLRDREGVPCHHVCVGCGAGGPWLYRPDGEPDPSAWNNRIVELESREVTDEQREAVKRVIERAIAWTAAPYQNDPLPEGLSLGRAAELFVDQLLAALQEDKQG